jgi:hypothetical protein
VKCVGQAEIEAACDRYDREYGIRLSSIGLTLELLEAQILRKYDGNFYFFYSYYFHFFAARYFRDKIKDEQEGPNLRTQLDFMADRVYFEDYVNILVFYLYLSKDTRVIEYILANACSIFSGITPSSLEADIDNLNNMSVLPPGCIALPSEDIEKNREELRHRLDEVEEAAPPPDQGQKLVYSDELDDLIKMNIAFKTVHILGQVLRNFPGDIKKDLKLRIAEQCYLLGLRVLGFALGMIDSNSEHLRRYFVLLLQERKIDGSAAVLGGLATKALLEIAIMWTCAVAKTVSQAVGMEELSETYREVLTHHGSLLSVQIIDTSIRLDHFEAFPEIQLEALSKRTRRNFIAFSTIRNLLSMHYKLYRRSPGNRSKFASMFGIKLEETKFVEGGLSKS